MQAYVGSGQVYSHVHILLVLIDLQWLPVLLLTYKTMHGVAPSYLIDILKFYDPVMCLRSKSKKTRFEMHQLLITSLHSQ